MSLPPLDNLDKKAMDAFPRKVVRKGYVRTIPELKDLPEYVSEYLISKYADNEGFIRRDAIQKVVNDIRVNVPKKGDKEAIKQQAIDLGYISIIDHFEVFTNLKKGKFYTYIQTINEPASVDAELVSPRRHHSLLKGGLWGKAKFQYSPQNEIGSLNMSDFESYQSSKVVLHRYINNRAKFSTEEWIDFMLRTVGYNPKGLTRKLKFLYLGRLIPIIESASNMLELGPPGTGKSFIFENISNYCRMILGGEISSAKLIFNQQKRENGLVFTKDVLCFDEIIKHNRDFSKHVPKLQQIMASNRVERGDLDSKTLVSLVYQGNIDFVMKDRKLIPKDDSYLKLLPKDTYDSAF
ncbi:MAG: BREX system Lon protease-like protein BrxL, partial [Candidatus Helarchaeota archaeon]